MTEEEKEEILWEMEYEFAVEYVDTYFKFNPNETSMQFWFQTEEGKGSFRKYLKDKYQVRLSLYDTGGYEIRKLAGNK